VLTRFLRDEKHTFSIYLFIIIVTRLGISREHELPTFAGNFASMLRLLGGQSDGWPSE
jgi:hypothetical protein